MTVLYAVVLLGILIFVHELGHFLVAKMLGVKVLKFSLGFGPKIIGTTVGETEYRLSALPLGGYVKMLGEEPGEELEESEKKRAFNFQPVWKKALIVFFGPLFNLCFAGFIFMFIFLSGIPVSYPDVGKVEENSPAARAGLIIGDRIIEINGQAVDTWGEIDVLVNKQNGGELSMKVKRGKKILEFSVTPEKKTGKNILGEEKEYWDIGISRLLYPEVGDVMPGTPADEAGLKSGDTIVSIDGALIKTWYDMTSIIHESPGTPLEFRIKRDGQVMDMPITPEMKTAGIPGQEKEVGLIGINPADKGFTKSFGLIESISLAVKKTWEMTVLTILVIVKLVQRVLPIDSIGGPILIIQAAGHQAAKGALDFFFFMAALSVNLGVINLFPIPILDGGHLLFFGVEAARKKPLSEKFMMNAQKVGIALLLALIAFVTYNDIMRLISGKIFPW